MDLYYLVKKYFLVPAQNKIDKRRKRYLIKMDLIRQGFNKDLFLSTSYRYPLQVCSFIDNPVYPPND